MFHGIGLFSAVLFFVDGLSTSMTHSAVAPLSTAGFEGTPGSVYIGQAVNLPLALLVLPLGAWVAGSYFGGRLFAWGLARVQASGSSYLNRPLELLHWSGLHRRAQGPVGAIILGLTVALATSVAVFTASYDGAKTADAR